MAQPPARNTGRTASPRGVSAIPPTIQGLLIAFVVLLVAFRLVELLRPKDKRLVLFRRGFWTDVTYWAFTPLVIRASTRACVIIAIAPVEEG